MRETTLIRLWAERRSLEELLAELRRIDWACALPSTSSKQRARYQRRRQVIERVLTARQ